MTPPDPAIGLASTYAQRITAALPLVAAQRVSMYDSQGRVCWQSAAPAGSADGDVVQFALQNFVGPSAPGRAERELPEQRTAVLLRAADAANVFRGFVVLVVENRRFRGRGQPMRDLPFPVQRAVHDWAVRLAQFAEPLPA